MIVESTVKIVCNVMENSLYCFVGNNFLFFFLKRILAVVLKNIQKVLIKTTLGPSVNGFGNVKKTV